MSKKNELLKPASVGREAEENAKKLPKETNGKVKFTPLPELITKKQVTVLLQEQVKRCASAIDGDNLSQYTAKKKIEAVELVEIK